MNDREAARTVRDGCLAAWSLAEHLPDAAVGKTFRDGDGAL